MEKMWKSFHMWKTYMEKWKTYGKLFKRKNAQKITLFCAKGRTKKFLKKTEKKEGKRKQTAELLQCNV